MITKIREYYRVSCEKGYAYSGHMHEGYEINIVLGGELEVTCGNNVFKLKSGDMVLFDANVFHHNYANTNCVFISLGFEPQHNIFVKDFLQFYRLGQENINIINIIDNEIRFGLGRKSESAKHLLWALILRAENDVHSKSAVSSPLGIVYHNAVNFITQNINQNLTLSHIATSCNVSLTTLKYAFMKYASKGVGEYCFEIKMEKAREMLLKGVSSKETALSLGFSSPSYFSQCFKRKNGCSVRDYCKNKKQG
ncbi:MAG: AraC family transcriptional regulator [Ruminococcaceae bacterium]|nr:AraC family transcriptional regulator [Oscillospiraceae bacterium]